MIDSSPDGLSRRIRISKPLAGDDSIAAAVALNLTCPLEGCAGHLYEVLGLDGRRRLVCTDHRM